MTIKEFLDLNKEVIEYRNCVALMDENQGNVPDEVYAETYGTLVHLEESLMEAIDAFERAVDDCAVVSKFDVRVTDDGEVVLEEEI